MHKLLRVQNRAIRGINNNTKYRHHTDTLFKRNNVVKVSDLYQLQVFSFMHDLVNNKLPGSIDDFIPITNESNYDIATRQGNRLYMTRPRTTFSSNLPNHNFANIWNEIDQIYKKCEPKNKAKKLLGKQFTYSYTVRCHNPRCDECNNNNNCHLHLVPSSRIRPLAIAVAAPLHPALSLAYRLMLQMVAPLAYPLSVSSHLCLGLPLSFSLHSFSQASRHLPSLLLSPRCTCGELKDILYIKYY